MTSTASLREDMARRGLLPGALPLDEAAAYVGLSRRTFLKEVAAGKLPKPIALEGRRKLFSRIALDRHLAGLHAVPVTDQIDAAIDAYEP